jgi:hypothetical protein
MIVQRLVGLDVVPMKLIDTVSCGAGQGTHLKRVPRRANVRIFTKAKGPEMVAEFLT